MPYSIPMDLPALDPKSGLVRVIIDTPRGSRNKYKYDSELGVFKLSRILPAGMSFPFTAVREDKGRLTMSELQPGEPGPHGVRRILCDWIESARDSLRGKVSDADVHDARKELKKARAALRLLRPAIGEITYERENAALRDAAHPLGVARDGKVLIAALDGLIERYAPAAESLPLEKFRRVLGKERVQARRALTASLLGKQRKALNEVATRSKRWRLDGDDWEMLGAGIERVYRGGRKKLRIARSADSEHLHAWRKQVKYLWHQLQILQPVWPGLVGELADQTHKLGDYLGDDHDLAVLRQKIVANEAAFEAAGRDALLALLDRRRRQLQGKAFVLGERIFEEKPRRFGRRLGKYWRAWQVQINRVTDRRRQTLSHSGHR